MVSSHHLWFCACKTATLGLELQVSVGPSPYQWSSDAKQRLLDPNNMSLWVPDLTGGCVCMQNSVISTSLYGSQPSPVVFAPKTATFGPELQVSMGPRPLLSFCA